MFKCRSLSIPCPNTSKGFNCNNHHVLNSVSEVLASDTQACLFEILCLFVTEHQVAVAGATSLD